MHIIVNKLTGWYYAGDGRWTRSRARALVYSMANARNILVGMINRRVNGELRPIPAETRRVW